MVNGPVSKIEKTVKDILTPKLKGKGKLIFNCHSDNFAAPLEHKIALYEAVKEYGRY